MFNALSTACPLIISATNRPFWADNLTPLNLAVVCINIPVYLAEEVGEAFLSAPPAFEWPLKVRVCENSPSLCPTIFSVIYTGICCLPLCTAIVKPMKSGKTVERRDQVLIGLLSDVAREVSTFFMRCKSTNGPFLIERAMCVPYPVTPKPWNCDDAQSYCSCA